MAWTIDYSDHALKSLQKMDKQNAIRIIDVLENRIALQDAPEYLENLLKAIWVSSGGIESVTIVFCVR